MQRPANTAPASGPTITARRTDVARLTAEGLDQRAIADKLGCSQATVWNDRKALGIVTPKGRRPKHPPAPADRRCATCGDLLEFRFPSDAAGNKGRYCSPECRHEAISKYPKPEPERTCETCGTTFPPRRAYSHGRYEQRYCSVACSRTGELVACARCGREVYFASWALSRGYRFCSPRCWAGERWDKGIALAGLIARYGGKPRRLWKLKWTRSPGRARGYTDEQERWVVNLTREGYSKPRIAETVGLSTDQVARIRRAHKAA